MGHYVCKTCSELKPETEFKVKQKVKLKSGRVAEYRNCHCISCWNKKASVYKNKAPHSWIRSRYLVDDVTAKYWWERSQTSCEICSKPWEDGQEKLCIDHDHSTGKIRGVLCKHCNHVLGHSREDSKILYNSIAYLDSHREN